MDNEQPSLAKITRPRLSCVLARERLFQQIDSYGSQSIIWISGPPGAGKTTLVSNYLDEKHTPCLWYQLDESDADLATFLHYMGYAVAKAVPSRKKPLPQLTMECITGLSNFMRRYFEELYQSLKPPFTVVFDDYYRVPLQSPFHDAITEGLAAIPEGIRCVVISRGDPPPAMARLRMNDKLKIIDSEDLKLTAGETRDIARIRGHDEYAKQAIDQLYNITEGWVAGLVLILEQAKTGGTLMRSPGAVTQEILFHYFASEIFHKTNNATQKFLLQTAFLPRMTFQLAEQLTAQRHAKRILSELHKNNYFTIQHGHPESVYQYHPLFREFLLTQARDSFSATEIVQIQKKAAKLLLEFGHIEDAFDLICATGDRAGMVNIILRNAPELMQQGRSQTLWQWLTKLPEAVLKNTPWLLYWLGICRMPFNQGESRTYFEQAFTLFEAQNDCTGSLLACSGVMDAILFQLATPKLLDSWIPRAIALLNNVPLFPSPEMEARVKHSIFLALLIRQPQHPETEKWAEQVLVASQNASDVNLVMLSLLDVSFYYLFIGRMAEALRVIDLVREMAHSPFASPLPLTTLKTAEAMFFMLQADYKPCLASVREGLHIMNETGVNLWRYQMMAHGVAGALSCNDLAAAGRLLKDMASSGEGAQQLSVSYHHCIAAWYEVLRGNLNQAFQHQKAGLELAQNLGMPFIVVLSHYGTAQILTEQAQFHEAENELSKASQIALAMRSEGLRFMCLLGAAGISFAQAKEKDGLVSLRQAFVLGREQGYINCYWWRPSIMADLCVKALNAEIEVKYVQDLIRARQLIPSSAPLDCIYWPWNIKIFTLGRFELVCDGKPIKFSAKAQRKPLELLKALISFGGREVPDNRLIDALWPDSDIGPAYRAFVTTLQRLRHLLGCKEAVQLSEGCLTLDDTYCWVDAWAFERLLGHVDSVAESLDKMQQAIGLYHGLYLGYSDEPWATRPRERLRSKFLRYVDEIGRHFYERKRYLQAVKIYKQALEIDDIAEELYRGLMQCYQSMGCDAEAITIYYRCRNVLAKTLRVQPSPQTIAIYQAINSKQQGLN